MLLLRHDLAVTPKSPLLAAGAAYSLTICVQLLADPLAY